MRPKPSQFGGIVKSFASSLCLKLVMRMRRFSTSIPRCRRLAENRGVSMGLLGIKRILREMQQTLEPLPQFVPRHPDQYEERADDYGSSTEQHALWSISSKTFST